MNLEKILYQKEMYWYTTAAKIHQFLYKILRIKPVIR